MKLLDDEEIEFTNGDSETHSATSNDELNLRHAAGEIRIVTEYARHTLPSLGHMMEKDNYNLRPYFQRRRRWTRRRQSSLIETFIMNVPVPPVYLYESRLLQYEVMDGQQRLTAIKDFYADSFELEGLEYWRELNGRRYSSLPERFRLSIDRRYLSSVIVLYETTKDAETARGIKQLLFQRLNSGGERLRAQEMRNALYFGPLNDLCMELSENEIFRKALSTYHEAGDEDLDEEKYRETTFYKEMTDVELVLRFFADRQRDKYRRGSAIHSYLDNFLVKGNGFSKRLLEEYRHLFVSTVKLARAVLGEFAFCRWNPDRGTFIKRPSTTIYEPVMHAFSQHLAHADLLKERASEIQDQVKKFYELNGEAFTGGTHVPGFAKRNNLMSDFISAFTS